MFKSIVTPLISILKIIGLPYKLVTKINDVNDKVMGFNGGNRKLAKKSKIPKW